MMGVGTGEKSGRAAFIRTVDVIHHDFEGAVKCHFEDPSQSKRSSNSHKAPQPRRVRLVHVTWSRCSRKESEFLSTAVRFWNVSRTYDHNRRK
jgi:hypothetical protein